MVIAIMKMGLSNAIYVTILDIDSQKIEDLNIQERIQKQKNFFHKWNNGHIELRDYIENYVSDEHNKEKLTKLYEELKRSGHTLGEIKSIENLISNFISNQENK